MPKPIRKSAPVTEGERRLAELCEGTFLSLWSYPSVFHDKGVQQRGQGQQLCDLLVVFGEHVLIFSDKESKFESDIDVEVAWGRWFKHAVLRAERQLRGAERWLRHYPDRVFVDGRCEQPFPVPLPRPDEAIYHLLAVTHGVSEDATRELGTPGGLVVTNTVPADCLRQKPFTAGDLEPGATFVHVFDDFSLPVAISTLDTISDFVGYLTAKEALLRSERPILARSEEDLIAVYLTSFNAEGRRCFPSVPDDAQIFVDAGQWEHLIHSDAWADEQARNELSYAWDRLIESFAEHTLNDTRFFAYPREDFASSETVLRFLAAESRVRRRTLGRAWLEALVKSDEGSRYTRWLVPPDDDSPYYVFLYFPRLPALPYETYRELRGKALEACCRAVKLKWPAAKDILGIATESGLDHSNRAEDAMYLDARVWCAEEERISRELASSLKMMEELTLLSVDERAYNDEAPWFMEKLKASVFRSACPCGSQRPFEECHARS